MNLTWTEALFPSRCPDPCASVSSVFRRSLCRTVSPGALLGGPLLRAATRQGNPWGSLEQCDPPWTQMRSYCMSALRPMRHGAGHKGEARDKSALD